ncbi:MAG: PocR ligand-binding domain-containing protein [Syntrophomonas sp.]
MPYRLTDLLDISQLEQLLKSFYAIAKVGMAILDVDGTVLVNIGWQPICVNFHRVCPASAQNCKTSDLYINSHLHEKPYITYKCLNGLIDCAAPIIADNQHLGTVFTGQFLNEPPDEDFFRQQACQLGFDETAYLKALQDVPLIPTGQVETIMAFYAQLAQLLASMGLDRMRQLDAWKTIKEREERLTVVLEESHDGFWDWDLDDGTAYYSSRWTEILGYSQDEIEPYISSWENLIHPEDRASVMKNLQSHYTGTTDRYEAEYRMLAKSGEWRWIQGRGKALIRNEKGQAKRVAGTHIDVTECKHAHEKLRHMSLHNFLTGLYNRVYFEQEMKRLEVEGIIPVGIIICDIDGLKLINDTMGHNAGDNMLRNAARIIKKCFPEDIVVARIGGDEFAILIPNCDQKYMEEACTRIKNAVAWGNAKNPGTPLSLSIGFAWRDSLPLNMNSIFSEADNHMYREKLHSRQSLHSTIVNTLMKALEERDFITGGHVNRLQHLVVSLAYTLGLPVCRINELRLLAQFHDIGKVGISDRILFKNGPLTDEEFIEMQRHSEIGCRIAQTAPELVPIADWILKHHEWWNGNGYPLGLKGEEIPLECRILAIADAFDAMISDRPYRYALSCQEAINELNRCSGTQFDPNLVEMFSQVLKAKFQLELSPYHIASI